MRPSLFEAAAAPSRRRLLCALPAAAAAALLPWPALAAPIVVRDDRGVEYRFAAPPQRIVTMLPSLTESAWVLGAGARLVGVDRYSNWPPEIAGLPHLGGLDDAQIEAIAALAPDVILAARGARAMDRLEHLGLRVLRLKSDSHADMRRTLLLIARLLGTPAAGERAWAQIEQEIDAAAARVPPRMRGLRVYFEIAGGPYAAGSSSFIGQTLTRLGLANIVPAALGPYPKLNPEFVVRAQPDLIMGPASEQPTLARRPGWAALPAVREQQLCGFDSRQYDMLVRPGPRLGEAAELIVACLQRLDAAR